MVFRMENPSGHRITTKVKQPQCVGVVVMMMIGHLSDYFNYIENVEVSD